MKIIKNIWVLIFALLLSFTLANGAGMLYLFLFPLETAGSFINGTPLIGLPLAYIFFVTFFFTLFGDAKKYWWIGVALIPATLFEIAFDFLHIYFPIAIGLAGWAFGWVILAIFQKLIKRTK